MTSITIQSISFRCAVTQLRGGQLFRQKRWIEGHDLSSLAGAASVLLGCHPRQCTYALTTVGPPGSTFLEVTSSSGEALVGPMAGPLPPAPSDHPQTLPQLLEDVGLTHDPVICTDVAGPGRLLVIVRYTSLWDGRLGNPHALPGETTSMFERRRRQEEEDRLDSARHEGFHVLPFSIPPEHWTAADLEHVITLAYRFLSARQPEWHEVGLLSRAEHSAQSHPYSLLIERGDYAATVRLPTFPSRAILEWVEGRRCELDLRQPVTRLRSDEVAPAKPSASTGRTVPTCVMKERAR